MSNWETPEQRQIRELRARIRYLESRRDNSKKENQALQKEIQRVRKQQEEANRNLQAKMRQADEKLRKANAGIAAQSQRIQQLDAQIKERERAQNQKIAQMQAAHAEQIQNMSRNFQAQQQKLGDAIVATRVQMQEGFQRIEKETDRKLTEQRVQFNQKLNHVKEQLDTKITAVDSKLDHLIESIRAKENGEKELAVYWTEQANRILNEMMENYRPQLFAPKELAKLREKIRIAEEDLSAGRFSSSADGGREAFYDAMDLKEAVQQEELEWNFWFNALKERELQLTEMLRRGENRIYELELDGEELEDDQGMDYWTRGQFGLVKERIADFRREKLGNLENRTTEYLQEQVSALLGLTEELLQVENASHTNFAMAVNRYTLTEKIGALLGENYQMIDSDGNYFAQENREEYHAIFQNPVTGDQAAVVITPVTGPDGIDANHVELIIGNADNNPVTRDRINAVIQNQLAQEGLIQGGFPCSQKYGARTAAEVQRVGNIHDVEAGKETARASREGVRMPQGTRTVRQ